jgi:hypothetical protein
MGLSPAMTEPPEGFSTGWPVMTTTKQSDTLFQAVGLADVCYIDSTCSV